MVLKYFKIKMTGNCKITYLHLPFTSHQHTSRKTAIPKATTFITWSHVTLYLAWPVAYVLELGYTKLFSQTNPILLDFFFLQWPNSRAGISSHSGRGGFTMDCMNLKVQAPYLYSNVLTLSWNFVKFAKKFWLQSVKTSVSFHSYFPSVSSPLLSEGSGVTLGTLGT